MVDHDAFLDWAESRFGNDVLVSGREVKINSIFTEDHKHHLYCNTDKGVFYCFKSGEKGSLVKLVATVNKCGYDEAAELIGAAGGTSIRQLEARLLLEFGERPVTALKLPPNAVKIAALSAENRFRRMAEDYLSGRKLPLGDLMVCVDGEYRDRVVIPYYGRDGGLVYWNSRDLTGKAYLRYRGPKKEDCAVGKSDVLWFDGWPRPGTKAYLTEGEFDAMSLNLAGLTAGACGGKEVSDRQLGLVAGCGVAVAFDADKSGAMALNKLGEALERFGNMTATFVRPPTKYKDWNAMLIDAGPRVVRAYVQQTERPFNGAWTANSLIFNSR